MNTVFPYDPRLFVNRDPEIQRVCDKISGLAKGTPVFPPHTAFHGPRGCGKSWLIRYLQEILPQKFPGQIHLVFSPLVSSDLQDIQRDDKNIQPPPDIVRKTDSATQMVEHTLRSASEALGLRIPKGASREEMSSWLAEYCRQAERPVVILVDELDKVPPDRLKEIELYYIAPLYRFPRVLFVLGSRVPAPGGRLNDVEFKRWVENRVLPPFDLGQTKEQLQKMKDKLDPTIDPAIAPDIRQIGGGYPISNAILAHKWATDPCKALEECVQALLEGIPGDLQEYFQALCVPDVIEIDRMPSLLAAYLNEDVSHWDTQRCRRILNDMMRTRLVRWGTWTSGYGYGMDPAVRQALRNALERCNPERWEKLRACLNP